MTVAPAGRRAAAAPPDPGPLEADTLPGLFEARVRRSPDGDALLPSEPGGAAAGPTLTWRDWHGRSRRFAAALVVAGHGAGDAVAVWADNRPLWPVADVGVALAGGVSLGLYPTAAPAQVRARLDDAGARWLVADTAGRLRAVLEGPRPGDLEAVIAPAEAVGAVADDAREDAPDVIPLDAWLERGRRARAERGADDELAARRDALSPGDTALLIYTSGSTGRPKAARISHACALASARSIREVLELGPEDSALSFLPFCHAAERIFGLHTRILAGMEAALVPDASRVWEAARAHGPTLFGAVPRFFEKASDALRDRQREASGEAAERWERTLELGRRRSRLRRAGEPVPDELERAWREVGEPVRREARELFGGRVRRLTSGGAALPEEVAEHLDAVGLTVLGAYGLTEHLCVAMNRPDSYAFDAAGPPMPGTEIRIADDGEILVRANELTFSGYVGRPDETRAAFTDDGAWLKTGDLGEIDDRGHLSVRGRKKDVLALSTGKTVAPAPVEEALAEQRWVGRAVLVGDGRKYVAALVVPARAAVLDWAREAGLEEDFAALASRPEVRERVEEAVERVNRDFSRSERVRRFALLDRELDPELGEVTATDTVRRDRILELHADRVEALYGD